MQEDAEEEERVSSGSYVFLVFLTLLNVMNFVDRQLLASFANYIMPDLNLTNTEFGLLTGSSSSSSTRSWVCLWACSPTR